LRLSLSLAIPEFIAFKQSIKADISFSCVKNEKAAGCSDILNPAVKDEDAEDEEDDLDQPMRRRHFF